MPSFVPRLSFGAGKCGSTNALPRGILVGRKFDACEPRDRTLFDQEGSRATTSRTILVDVSKKVIEGYTAISSVSRYLKS